MFAKPRTHRPLFHVSATSLDEVSPRRGNKLGSLQGSLSSYVEPFLEDIRSKEFSYRPSRLSSAYFSPHVEGSFARGMNNVETHVGFFPKSEKRFITSQDSYSKVGEVYASEVMQHYMKNTQGGLDTSSETISRLQKILEDKSSFPETAKQARHYWKGPNSFGELRRLIKNKDAEVLIPHAVPVKRFNRAVNTIEGLSHAGWAPRLRKLLTSFGSPWQGLGAGPELGTASDRRGRDDYNMTPGQTFDLADAVVEAHKNFQSNAGPWSWGTAAFSGLDIGISAGKAKPEEMLGATTGAVASTVTGLAGFSAGGLLGRVIGGAIGTSVAGPLGATVGSTVGGFVTSIALPFFTDPFVRKISKPINRLVGSAKHHLNFDSNFQDSVPAYTMRQRALVEMQGSLLNATQWMGREAQLVHM